MRFETREQYELYKYADALKAKQDAIRPLIEAKNFAMACMLPEMILTRAGQMYTNWKPEDRKVIDQYDRLIQQMWELA